MEELNGNANDNQTMNLQKIVKKKSKAIKTKKVDKSYSS